MEKNLVPTFQLYVCWISFSLILIFTGCSAKDGAFTIHMDRGRDSIEFTQIGYSKVGYDLKMGPNRLNYNFDFSIKSLKHFYYAYLSIETWDVGSEMHRVTLNGREIGYLQENMQDESMPTRYFLAPMDLEATQIYIPKEFFVDGKNTISINTSYTANKNHIDRYIIRDLDISVVHLKRKKLSISDKANLQNTKKSFPGGLSFFSNLTDEELYVTCIGMPELVSELNLGHGVYKKRLGYIYTRIGDFYRWRGDYVKNLNYQKKALSQDLDENLSSLRPYLYAQVGMAYHYVGESKTGLGYCKKALVSLNEIPDEDLRDVSATHHENFTELESMIRAYMATIQYSLREYEIAEENASSWLWGDPITRSMGCEVLGNISLRKGEIEKAILRYDMALKPIKNNYSIYRDRICNIIFAKAMALFKLGNTDAAKMELNSIENPTHEFQWRSYVLRGDIAKNAEVLTEAADNYGKAIDCIEYSRNLLNKHGFKISFMKDKQVAYSRMISVLVKLGNYQKAFEIVEKAKARGFLDLISNKKQDIFEKRESLRSLSEEETRLRNRLEDMVIKSESQNRMFGQRGIKKVTNHEIKMMRKELERFYQEKAFQNYEFTSLTTENTINLHQLQAIIPEDTMLIEYYYNDTQLYIWSITNTNMILNSRRLEKEAIETMVRDYRQLISNIALEQRVNFSSTIDKGFEKTEKMIELITMKLSHILFDSVLDTEHDRVYVVPHGVLHYFPFQAAKVDGSYLIEKKKIGYLPNATIYEYLRNTQDFPHITILALGNPYSQQEDENLPFSEKEVLALAGTYPGTKVYTGSEATEALFKENAPSYPILHLASHGEYLSEAPLQSAIELAKGGGEDGRLEAWEIFGLDLNAYLVTLSACNSAIGKLVQGDEIVGLSRAFMFAGTPSILGTIWKVDDKSTELIMKKFYADLINMDKMESLQSAQVHLLNSNKYSHPYYWAAFCLIGHYL